MEECFLLSKFYDHTFTQSPFSSVTQPSQIVLWVYREGKRKALIYNPKRYNWITTFYIVRHMKSCFFLCWFHCLTRVPPCLCYLSLYNEIAVLRAIYALPFLLTTELNARLADKPASTPVHVKPTLLRSSVVSFCRMKRRRESLRGIFLIPVLVDLWLLDCMSEWQ